jgi:hypothetical protein
VDLEIANLDDATRLLRPIATSDTDLAPRAVLSLAKIAQSKGEKLGVQDQNALEVYQEELKGTKIEPDLMRARIIAAMQDGDFELAVSLVDEFEKLVRPSQTHLVLDELGSAIYSVENDTTFLKEAVSLPAKHFTEMSEAIQSQMKERVSGLGFSELAAQLGKLPRNTARSSEKQPFNVASLSRPEKPKISNETKVNQEKPSGGSSESRQANEQSLQPNILPVSVPSIGSQAADIAQETGLEQQVPKSGPLISAVSETEEVLSGMDSLKEQMKELGL